MTNRLRAALAIHHVRTHFPDVYGLVIHPDGRWMFFTETNDVPSFPRTLDIGPIEEYTEDLPSGAYFMPDDIPVCEVCKRPMAESDATMALCAHKSVICETCVS